MNAMASRFAFPRMILPLSIILNIFLVAVIAGHMIRQRSEETQTGLAHALANAEKNLPLEDAEKFRDVMRKDGPQFLKAAANLAYARNELEKLVAAETFDAAATAQALDTWENTWVSFVNDFKGTLIEALGKISPEGRRKLVDGRRLQGLRAPLFK